MTHKKDEALKLALEGAANYIDALGGDSRKYRQALAEQPAQVAEPRKQQEHVSVMTVLHLKDRTEIGYGPASAGYDLPTGEYKLYTSPQPCKPWVGLTSKEREELDAEAWHFGPETQYGMRVSEMTEAKLREKNHG